MANIIDMADARIKIRDQMSDQIRHADKDADANVEADKLLVSFAKALEEAPLAQEEKLLASRPAPALGSCARFCSRDSG